MPPRVLVVHGGAGLWAKDEKRAGRALKEVKEVAERGFDVLKSRGALEAVVECVKVMEDSDCFNAGIGSTLAIDGSIAMDAAVMLGSKLDAGAVALVKDIKNPVVLAKLVMEKTAHVLMAGDGAMKLAEHFGLEKANLFTEYRKKVWEEYKERFERGELTYLSANLELLRKMEVGTVGAVALDSNGEIAAAVSTGGLTLKLPGRIGDSAIVGAGIYADRWGGCVATGIGEGVMRLVACKEACLFMEQGLSAQEATEKVVKRGLELIGPDYPFGLIAVDCEGNIGAAHSTPQLCWAYKKEGMKEAISSLSAVRV